MKFISRKAIIAILIVISFAMSTSTFAYWAGHVEGAFNTHTMTFRVGSPTFQDYEFVLYDEYDEGYLEVDTEALVNYNHATGDSIDVIFGLLWEDQSRENEDGTTTTARIELEYEVYAEIYGKEVSNKKYRKINKVLDVTFDQNYLSIPLNSTTVQSSMNIAVNQNATRNQYKVFDKSDIMIIVTYRIIYETTE
jgi:hypothetical protein